MPDLHPLSTYGADWRRADQPSHPIFKSAHLETNYSLINNLRFQPLDHVPDENFPNNMVGRWGFKDWVEDQEADSYPVLSQNLLHLPCKVGGRNCKQCKNTFPRFVYTHDKVVCQNARDHGCPTLLFRFTFTSDQRSLGMFTCAWCAAVRRGGTCDVIGKGRHKFVMRKSTDEIVLEIGKAPRNTTGSAGISTDTLHPSAIPQTDRDDSPLHLRVFPPPLADPVFPQYGLIAGTLEGVNAALEQWKTTNDYKRKLSDRSPQPLAGSSKRSKAEMEGPLTLTQLSDKYPSVFGDIDRNIRPWINGTHTWAEATQNTYAVGKARAPELEEAKFWRSDKYGDDRTDMAKRDVMQENATLRAQLGVARERLRQFENPSAWNYNTRAFASIPSQPFHPSRTQVQGDDTLVDPNTSNEVGKPVMWMRERPFEDKMTSADWNNEAMRVFAGDGDDGL